MVCIFNTEKYVIYKHNHNFSQTLTPSEWWSYISLLVVSEEYTLDNIWKELCVWVLDFLAITETWYHLRETQLKLLN